MLYRMNSYRNHIPHLQFPIKLDLGAGAFPKEGFVRLDFDPCNGQTDIVWDVTGGIPLPDGSVCELFSSHFLEHLVETDAHLVLQDVFRICTPGAAVTIKLPHGATVEGHLPCHYSRWTEETLRAVAQWFPNPGHPEYNGNFFKLEKLWRESYHIIATYTVIKGGVPTP